MKMRKPLVQMAAHRDYLQVRINMTYKKLWGRLTPEEQVEALMQMAAYLRTLAEQMETEATDVVERTVVRSAAAA